MLWKKEVSAELHFYSNGHISLIITKEDEVKKWMLYGFYGSTMVEKIKESW